MIFVGKAPYRVSLLGGSSDLDWFVKENGYGVCLGYSLNRYSYSVLNVLPKNSSRGILEYSNREEYSKIEEIVHPIVREVLFDLDISKFIELKTFGFASGGAGLGGSGSFMISLISSLSKAFKLNLSNQEIVEKACFIEIHKLKKPVGKQDQYLCGNSGLNAFKFHENDLVDKIEISLSKEKVIKRLSKDFYLIPTNKQRSSDIVLSKIKVEKQVKEKILEIRKIAEKFIIFEDEREDKIEQKFHDSIKESWEIKRSMSNVMTEDLDDQYELINKLIPNNWIRLIGAGKGGYFLVSSKRKEADFRDIYEQRGIKGIFKASISDEGIKSFQI